MKHARLFLCSGIPEGASGLEYKLKTRRAAQGWNSNAPMSVYETVPVPVFAVAV